MKERIINIAFIATFTLLILFSPFYYSGDDPTIFLTIIQVLFFVLLAVYLILNVKKTIAKYKDKKLSEEEGVIRSSSSILSILIGILFGFLIMLVINPVESVPGLFTILTSAFKDVKSIGMMITFSVPFILTGLSVAFAFRTGLFNIGASGQYTVGALAAVFVGYKWEALGDISPLLHWGTAILFAAIAGALWGAIPGLLKAYRNVNEVVTSIMSNYIAIYIRSIVIAKYMFNQATAAAHYPQATAINPSLNLDLFFGYSKLDIGIIIAILVTIGLHIILNKTVFGYELRAVGFNRHASRYAGINEKRSILLSMMIAGAVAGLAGGLFYLSEGIRLPIQESLEGAGFTGIAISLLGLSEPIGVLFAGLFYGALQVGGFFLQKYSFTPEIIDIIISIVIYLSALSIFFRMVITKYFKKRERDEK
jgi:ABC-type uncharacterized transport system permease subunit